MTQERPRVRIEKKQYFDQNIWDMSIDITYFVLDILQVVISRSTYYISFERMCLTVQSIRCFIRFDVQSTASYCLKLVQKIDRHEKNSYVSQILFLKKFLNSLNANVLDDKIHRFKIVCTTKNRIDQIIFDKMLCILHVESTRSALERHFLGVPTAWIFTETPLIKFDMIFDV